MADFSLTPTNIEVGFTPIPGFPWSSNLYTSITPFTHRDGETFMSMWARYEMWLANEVIPHLDGQILAIVNAWHDEVAALIAQINTYLKTQHITITEDADGFGTITIGAE